MLYKPAGGSIPEHVYQISKRLKKRGHNVTVYTTDLSIPSFKSTSVPEDFKVIRLHYPSPLFRIYRPLLFFKLHSRLIKEDYDLIHAHEFCPITEATAITSKLYRIPLVLTTHGLFSMMIKSPKLNLLDESYFEERLISKLAKKIICVSKADAHLLQNSKIAPPEKISVIGNGIDMEKWSVLPPYGHFRQTYKIGENEKIIACVGVITWRKGFQYAIFAMKYIINKIKAKLVIAGPDVGYLKILKELARRLKLENNIIFTGALDDSMLKALYRDCDVFVCPSIYEPYSLVILEAMACVKPIVATKSGGIPEFITEGANGLLVEPCNPKKLAEAIIKLLEDQNMASKLAKEAYRTALNHSWDHVVDALEKLYYDSLE